MLRRILRWLHIRTGSTCNVDWVRGMQDCSCWDDGYAAAQESVDEWYTRERD